MIQRIFRFLGSMRFAVVILLVLGVVLAWATVVDSQYGSVASSFAIYHSWWFLCLCGLLGVSVFTSAWVRFPWRKEQTGFLLTHLGILVLMAGCAITLWYGQDATLGIFEGTDNGIATTDSLHFQLTIQPSDSSQKGEERTISFQPGPFSWEFYKDGPFFAMGVVEKLPQFPWRWIPSSRTKPVLYEQDGIRLEILDYRTRVEMMPVSQQRQMEIVQDGKRETFFLSHARMDQRPKTASGEAIVYKKAANAEEVSAFLQCRPNFSLLQNPATEGLVTLWLEGNVYSIPLNQLPLGKSWKLAGTEWRITLLRVEPEINMAKLAVEKGTTRTELTLVADSPEMSTQGYVEKIYGYLWTQAEVLEYASPDGQTLSVSEEDRAMQPMMERMRKLIDCPRLEILESPDGKWYARAWKRPEWTLLATQGEELAENQPVEVFVGTPQAMTVKILPIPKEDIPGYAIVSVPLADWRLTGMEKKGLDLKFVKMALEVDGNRYEGWIRAQLPDPTFPEPSAAEWELISLPGKERTVSVSLAPDEVDLGFRLFLNRFHRRLDPGTSMAAHYSSEVSLLDRESKEVQQKNIRIHLNQPVDFADPVTHRIWRVYQSSFRGPILPDDPLFQKVVPPGDLREQLYISWFTVNYAPGRGWLYLGCLLMVVGMGLLGMRKIQSQNAEKEGR